MVVRRHDGVDRSTRHEGHDHPKFAVYDKRAVCVEDVGVCEELHGLGFTSKCVDIIRLRSVKIDCFYGDGGIGGDADGLVDDGRDAKTDLREDLVRGGV